MSQSLQVLRAGAASLIQKTAVVKDGPRPSAADLGLNMDSLTGKVLDYTGLGSYDSTRAGRAAHLSRAMHDGEELPADRAVMHPIKTDFGNLFKGLGGGGLLGAALGGGAAAASPLLGMLQRDGNGWSSHDTNNTIGGALTGAGLGAITGGIGNTLLGRGDRRDRMKEIVREYSDGAAADPKVKPTTISGEINKEHDYSLWPFDGPHVSGQTDVYEALNQAGRGPNRDKINSGFGRFMAQVPLAIAGNAAVPMLGNAVTGMGQLANADFRVNNVRDLLEQREKVKKQHTGK